MNLLRPSLLLLAIVLLSACQQTRFESLPSSKVSGCDRQLVGSWSFRESQTKEDPGGVLIIAPECANYTTYSQDAGVEAIEDFSFHYVEDRKFHYLGLRANPDSKDGGNNAGVDKKDAFSNWSGGDFDNAFLLYRYKFHTPNHILAYEVDNQMIAQMILRGDIRGRSEVINNSLRQDSTNSSQAIENLVRGDSKTISTLLKRNGVFQRKPSWEFHRISDEKTNRAIQQARSRNPEND